MDRKHNDQEQYRSNDAVNQKSEIGNRQGLDSKVNTSFTKSNGNESLTNDESAYTDPNQVKDKPSFK